MGSTLCQDGATDAGDATVLAAMDLGPRRPDMARSDERPRLWTYTASARELVAQGDNGLLVPNFAKGAVIGYLNRVLWRWDDTAPSSLELIDDEHRIG